LLAAARSWWRYLPGSTQEGIQAIIGGLLGGRSGVLDFDQFPPYITCTSLAEVDFRLNIGLKELDMVKNERESDQKPSYGCSTQNNCYEGGSAQVLRLCLFVKLLVFDHFCG
jgi:hypothetical protein